MKLEAGKNYALKSQASGKSFVFTGLCRKIEEEYRTHYVPIFLAYNQVSGSYYEVLLSEDAVVER